MHLDDYQAEAMKTSLAHELPYDCNPVLYFALKLNGEAGEIAEKVGKLFRDKKGIANQEWVVMLELELGDVLWYLAALANEYGIAMDWVAIKNLDKLASRMKRGKLGGSGDYR